MLIHGLTAYCLQLRCRDVNFLAFLDRILLFFLGQSAGCKSTLLIYLRPRITTRMRAEKELGIESDGAAEKSFHVIWGSISISVLYCMFGLAWDAFRKIYLLGFSAL